MNITSIQNIHDDHDKWLARINYWNSELTSYKNLLKKIIEDTDKKGKDSKELIENINTIKHNQRFLKELEEVIRTHEAFIEDISEMVENPESSDILMDHDKTRFRFDSFKSTFNKIQESISQFTQAT